MVLVRRLLVLAVAAAAVFDQAGFVVGVGARPAGVRRVAAAVLHLQEVADGVVHVALDVRAHGVAVVGVKSAAVCERMPTRPASLCGMR